ncbi:MAG: 1,4-alpha-glucan branching protein GlgB [Lachnospiraceae bacterium]|nr:1,4-alpha-glucan branching protein GlgB [Lachnospiraceae bacterium]
MNMDEFYRGTAFDCYEYFGAHLEENGVVFRVYAPNAKGVCVIGEFSNWENIEMTQKWQPQVYECYVENAKKGMLYKYRIYGGDGSVTEHCDPYGFSMELRPNFASVIVDLKEYEFTDEKWLVKRVKNYNKPMNIYEVHLASWHTNPADENGHYRYEEIADRLISYVKENHFNYIEFLPLSEHPFDGSWGYQNTGFFAPTSRYGEPKGLKELIDKCHKNDIGVIMDFVPVHFARDSYGLPKFDGTPLYEYDNNDVGESEWGSYNFIHSRGEVRSFLQSAANYWLSEYHFDGIRMDAISRAIYWQGDPRRGVNEKSVEFIKNMNEGLHKLHPQAILIAEDSTDFMKVTAPVSYGGLGFDYKWDMGFMNDTLEYFKLEPVHRPANYHKLTFSMQYFYNELFLLAFSHDEVVHGKATIIQKMWGQYEDKFPQVKAFYAYMYTHPGKKLNFMGNEFGQFREWDETREQDWDLLQYPAHDTFHHYYMDLCKLYSQEAALYDGEYNPDCFQWLEVHAEEFSTYVYERKGVGERVIVALNFSDQFWKDFTFRVETEGKVKELINSDWECYGGKTKPSDVNYQLKEDAMSLDLPPFSARIFKVIKEKKVSENN